MRGNPCLKLAGQIALVVTVTKFGRQYPEPCKVLAERPPDDLSMLPEIKDTVWTEAA